MSFILDALKKSESERRDRSGPQLTYATGGREREALPRWVVVLAILLLVNLLVLGGLFLVKPRQPVVLPKDATVNAAAVPVAEPPARAEPTGQQQDGAAESGTATANGPTDGRSAGQASISSAAGGPARSLQEEAAVAIAQPTSPELAGDAANMHATAPQPARADSEPAAPPEPVLMDTEPTPPSLSELQGRGMLMNLPALGMDLHVYAAQPEARFVFINLNRYREGERLREGPLVVRITPDGVILQHEGRRFLLPRS